MHLSRHVARVAIAAVVVGITCEQEGLPEGALCDPGTAIFCRCPSGDPGEKTCNESGDAFGPCEGCEDRPDATGGGPIGTGGGDPDAAPLFRACTDDTECQSGLCSHGYCTFECTKVSDCQYTVAECVTFSGATLCMPLCETAIDCEPFGAPPSACGYASAVDNWGVTVCANWGAEHELVPDGSDCAPFGQGECNLGYSHRERVCSEQGVCAKGCFGAIDCVLGKDCSSDGSVLGACN